MPGFVVRVQTTSDRPSFPLPSLDYINNSLHLARNHARIFVRGQSKEFSESVAGEKLRALMNRCCSATNVSAYLRAKWRGCVHCFSNFSLGFENWGIPIGYSAT